MYIYVYAYIRIHIYIYIYARTHIHTQSLFLSPLLSLITLLFVPSLLPNYTSIPESTDSLRVLASGGFWGKKTPTFLSSSSIFEASTVRSLFCLPFHRSRKDSYDSSSLRARAFCYERVRAFVYVCIYMTCKNENTISPSESTHAPAHQASSPVLGRKRVRTVQQHLADCAADGKQVVGLLLLLEHTRQTTCGNNIASKRDKENNHCMHMLECKNTLATKAWAGHRLGSSNPLDYGYSIRMEYLNPFYLCTAVATHMNC